MTISKFFSTHLSNFISKLYPSNFNFYNLTFLSISNLYTCLLKISFFKLLKYFYTFGWFVENPLQNNINKKQTALYLNLIFRDILPRILNRNHKCFFSFWNRRKIILFFTTQIQLSYISNLRVHHPNVPDFYNLVKICHP